MIHSPPSSWFCRIASRVCVRIHGGDAEKLLQGLITQDVGAGFAVDSARYGLLLNPQGKFLHDFLIVREAPQSFLFLIERERAQDFIKRLKMYKLKSDVSIVDLASEKTIFFSTDRPKNFDAARADPRLPGFGFWIVADTAALPRFSCPEQPEQHYDLWRIRHGIPDGSKDCGPGQDTAADINADVLAGIAWNKGCYVGQEVTARMHYKSLVKKRLCPVRFHPHGALSAPPVLPGTEIRTGEGTLAGEIRGISGDLALALLRIDSLSHPLRAGETRLTPELPEWLRAIFSESGGEGGEGR